MTDFTFNIGSTTDLQTDLALIDVGGADAGTGNTYTFNFTQSVTLSQQLYAVNLTDKTSTLTVNGGNATLSGNNQFNGLFVYSGTVNVNDLTISNAVAQGGTGGSGFQAAGGGAGLGGGLFVASGGAAALTNVQFAQDAAKGGGGGSYNGQGSGGGGGLEGGAGGTGFRAGGGGVGLGATGGYNAGTGNAGTYNGSAGIVPGTQAGGAGGSGGGNGGAFGGGGGGGATSSIGEGGGGGGGIGGAGGGSSTTGGGGGFGGGGGGGGNFAGRGGFGGGGGGGFGGSGGFGGGGSGGFRSGGFGGGGGGGNSGGGGGGLGAGGDIFIQQGGSLTIGGGSLAAGTVTGGAAGNTGTAGAGLGSGLFIQGDQTVTLAPGAGGSLAIDGVVADETGSTVANGSLIAGQGTGTGAGVLAIQSGTVTLSGANTYTGGTNLTGGEVDVGSNTALGSGTLAMSSGTTLGFSANNLTVANTVTVAGDAITNVGSGQTETESGTIADGATAGTVEKTGAGTLTFTGANTYSGGTMITGGTLDLASAATFNGTKLVSAAAGTGAIDFAGTSASPATLSVEAVAQPAAGKTFSNVLTNFGDNDALDLKGLAFSNTPGNGAVYNPVTTLLTVTEGGKSENYNLANAGATTYFARSDGNGGTLITDTVICYGSGTRIRVARGGVVVDAVVEDLLVGDLAVTTSGVHRPISWLGHRIIDCRNHPRPHEVLPVRISAHAFGESPARDLFLSPGHPVLVGADEDGEGGHLVPIMCLINGTTVRRVAVDTVTYWHVELDAHDILLAEGLPAESYIDLGSRPWFAGADGALYDPDMALPGMPGRCRPVAIDGPVVESERRRLDMVFATQLTTACAWPDEASCAFG